MKKIRYIPYGYTMRNGRTVIAQDEAMVIREIFSAYINGASLQSIAELLTERKIPYSERTDVWDKARIARIIGNAKYLGDGEYDPIIEEEQYEEAAAVRTARQRNTFEKNLEGIDLLRNRVRCAECGAPMRRRVSNRHRIRESWECTNADCGQRIRISDTHLLEKVTILMNRIIANSHLSYPAPKNEGSCRQRLSKSTGKSMPNWSGIIPVTPWSSPKQLRWRSSCTQSAIHICRSPHPSPENVCA